MTDNNTPNNLLNMTDADAFRPDVSCVSRRDYLAALAMNALLLSAHTPVETIWSKAKRLFGIGKGHVVHDYNFRSISKNAVDMADLLIEDLDK